MASHLDHSFQTADNDYQRSIGAAKAVRDRQAFEKAVSQDAATARSDEDEDEDEDDEVYAYDETDGSFLPPPRLGNVPQPSISWGQ